MSIDQIVFPITGGVLIGIAVTALLLFNGRIAGISGILSSSLEKPSASGAWRWLLIAGLLTGGFLVHALKPELYENTSGRSVGAVVIAGFLVGFGTVMGSGCTSGHGVCGISRLSVRSILATLTFMLLGFLTVQGIRIYFGGAI